MAVIIVGVIIIYSCSDKPKKEIVCWGDSLTAPHNGKGIKGKVKRIIKGPAYPEYLSEMLGDDYEIINGGVGGENTLTIMARQGAYPMKLAHDVVIFKTNEAKFETFVGNNDIDAFVSSYNEKRVTPLLQCGWDEDSPAQINPCMINGKSFKLSSEAKFWKEEGKYKFEYNYFINPEEDWAATDTIKAGSIISTYAMRNLRNKYANVFFIGQNGGFEDIADLIKQLKAMISYSKSERYIVISFHKPNKTINSIARMMEMEDSLQQTFSKHYINLRGYLVKSGLADGELTPSQEDKDSIAKGQVPPQLLTDGTHFTPVGYKLIATLVYNKMKELGY
ncbi:MAG: hypothetical protein IJ637_00500 [Prevotella sp.]|nr:hypothetical protein [Prevotella sp.]